MEILNDSLFYNNLPKHRPRMPPAGFCPNDKKRHRGDVVAGEDF